jgi:hypothetical protein
VQDLTSMGGGKPFGKLQRNASGLCGLSVYEEKIR